MLRWRHNQYSKLYAKHLLHSGLGRSLLACTITWLSSSVEKSSSVILTVDTSAEPRCGWNTKASLDQVSCSLTSA